MSRKNKNDIGEAHDQEETGYDPFLRRIQVQGMVIRKMLTKVDLLFETETDLLTDDQKNEDSFKCNNKDNQKD